jgi:hypothetical protein
MPSNKNAPKKSDTLWGHFHLKREPDQVLMIQAPP